MNWSPFDQKRTPLIYDPAYSAIGATLVQLRPVYYHLINDLLGGLPSFGPGDGLLISSTPNTQANGLPTGFFYAWNVNTNDDPYTVGGFYYGKAANVGYYSPLVFTNYAQCANLMLAGSDPNNDVMAWVQVLKGQV